MLFCFPDTSVLMEFQTFDEIDWQTELETDDDVCLIFSLRVIDELDKHKNDPTSDRRRRRSRTVLKKLSGYSSNGNQPIRQGVWLKLLTSNPTADWLKSKGVDHNDSDAVIIGTALWYQEQVTDPVILISDDYGFRLRALGTSLTCRAISEQLQLEEEGDPIQKENRKLQAELHRLKTTMPKLELGFWRHKVFFQEVSFSLATTRYRAQSLNVEAEIARKKHDLKYKGPINDTKIRRDANEPSHFIISIGANSNPEHPNEDDVKNYESKVYSYLEEYKQYLYELNSFKEQAPRIRPVRMMLKNTGSAPTEDIDVMLHFPKRIIVRENSVIAPLPPMPPEQPKPAFRSFGEMPDLFSDAHDYLLDSPISYQGPREPSPTKGPLIRNASEVYEVGFDLDRLKQHKAWIWTTIYLAFDASVKAPTAFQVRYTINAANMPERVENKLLIRIV